jgi:tetratricopeptide (TPR) repeat protein
VRVKGLIVLLSTLLLGGCASIATERMAGHLSMAMLNQSDPEIVRTGAPAYLLLVDSLIAEEPDNADLLLVGARLYGAYAGGLVEENERRLGLTDQALEYARRALCEENRELCTVLDLPYLDFMPVLEQTGTDDLPILYGYATAWLGWIEAHSDDWNAVAALPKAEAMLQRIIALQPDYERGRAQLYFGSLLALRPAALGGKPEQAREHFEQAIRFSEGRDLMAKVEYARRYARLVFDQDLHDRLLKEVIEADPDYPGLTLSNVIAQDKARALLQDNYF